MLLTHCANVFVVVEELALDYVGVAYICTMTTIANSSIVARFAYLAVLCISAAYAC